MSMIERFEIYMTKAEVAEMVHDTMWQPGGISLRQTFPDTHADYVDTLRYAMGLTNSFNRPT